MFIQVGNLLFPIIIFPLLILIPNPLTHEKKFFLESFFEVEDSKFFKIKKKN
jgi:hypothetical protein